jgi:hypothetical protein
MNVRLNSGLLISDSNRLVLMDFEKVFRALYDVGVDMAFEIFKHLAPLIRHEWNYNSAIRFLSCKFLFILQAFSILKLEERDLIPWVGI